MNKPKARYDSHRKLWIVWDGVSFNNGCSTHSELKHAYGYWVIRYLKSKKPDYFCWGMRFSKHFKMERRNGHK